MRLRTRTYSENITAGNKRRATNRSFTDPDPKRYLNHSLSIPRYPKTRVGFGMGFFRDPELRSKIFKTGIFKLRLDWKIPEIQGMGIWESRVQKPKNLGDRNLNFLRWGYPWIEVFSWNGITLNISSLVCARLTCFLSKLGLFILSKLNLSTTWYYLYI